MGNGGAALYIKSLTLQVLQFRLELQDYAPAILDPNIDYCSI